MGGEEGKGGSNKSRYSERKKNSRATLFNLVRLYLPAK